MIYFKIAVSNIHPTIALMQFTHSLPLILYIVCAMSKNISKKSIEGMKDRREKGSKARLHLSATNPSGRAGQRGDKVKETLNFTIAVSQCINL